MVDCAIASDARTTMGSSCVDIAQVNALRRVFGLPSSGALHRSVRRLALRSARENLSISICRNWCRCGVSHSTHAARLPFRLPATLFHM
jgi:hypothetical protein